MFSHEILSVNGSCALCTRPSISLTSKFCIEMCLSVGLMHCSRDLQTSFFTQTFIKNGSHGTIHTFKNYFATLFSGQRFNICFFLFFLFLIENNVFTWDIVCQWVLCTVYETHNLFDQQILYWNVSISGSRALFTRPTNLFFHTNFH